MALDVRQEPITSKDYIVTLTSSGSSVTAEFNYFSGLNEREETVMHTDGNTGRKYKISGFTEAEDIIVRKDYIPQQDAELVKAWQDSKKLRGVTISVQPLVRIRTASGVEAVERLNGDSYRFLNCKAVGIKTIEVDYNNLSVSTLELTFSYDDFVTGGSITESIQ